MGSFMDKMTIRKIKKRFYIIADEISQLVEDKYYFEKYKEYIKKSKNIDKNHDFLIFISVNYQLLAVNNVCKQVNDRKDVESLINLLNEIKNNRNLFTLDWYKKQWKNKAVSKDFRQKMSEGYFKQFSTQNNNRISCKKINKDIKNIEIAINGKRFGKIRQSIRSLRKYRNKRIAHFDKGKPKINTPVNDLYKAIDLLEKIVLKYQLLIDRSTAEETLLTDHDIEFEKIFKE